jgi:YbgC/YbaW family acyl-CoA thioester hydrolase
MLRAVAVEQVEHARVAWVDTDAGGRIHFTAAFRWAEVAETALMRRLGLLDGWGNYPRRRVEADYRNVLRFEDEIAIHLRVERVGTTSITYGWTIAKDGDLYVEGSHTVVHVDARGRPSPLPELVRAALAG